MEEFDKNVSKNDGKFLKRKIRVMNNIELCKNA